MKYIILIIQTIAFLSCSDSSVVNGKPTPSNKYEVISDSLDHDSIPIDTSESELPIIIDEIPDGWLIPEYLDVDSITTIVDSSFVEIQVSFNIRNTELVCINETDTCDVVVPRGYFLSKLYLKRFWGSSILPYTKTNMEDCCEGDHTFNYSFDTNLDSLILDSIVWANEFDTMTQVYDTVLYQKSDFFEIDPNEIVCPPTVNCYMKSEFNPIEGYDSDAFTLNKDLICDSIWWVEDFITHVQSKLNDSSLSVYISSYGGASPTSGYSESTFDESISYAYSTISGSMLAPASFYTIADSINEETYRLETNINKSEAPFYPESGYIFWTIENHQVPSERLTKDDLCPLDINSEQQTF